MNKFNAIIIKCISNQYRVVDINGKEYDALAMGKLRKGLSPLVGDYVVVEKINDKYCIQKINKRKNELIRPSIANVDQAIILMSCKDPDFSTTLLNRLLIVVMYAKIEPIILISKTDIADNLEDIKEIMSHYIESGYKVYYSSMNSDTSMLKEIFENKISVLTGQSGAGKSTLLNKIDDNLKLATQVISKALGRGKHTTRHCELYKIYGGWIADTPGFSSLDFEYMDLISLRDSINDFKPFINQCKYNNCLHINEPSCAVKSALEKNDCRVNKYIYDDYVEISNIVKNKKIKY